jgi:hypothetical protein
MPKALLGSNLRIVDNVQGVVEWLVEVDVNSGGYSEVETYECAWIDSAATETRQYSFAYPFNIAKETYDVGDTLKFKFTPTGYDTGNGNYWESGIYEVIGSTGGNRIAVMLKCKVGLM